MSHTRSALVRIGYDVIILEYVTSNSRFVFYGIEGYITIT